MEPVKLHHVALHTRNIKKSAAFYQHLGAVIEDKAVVPKWKLVLLRWHGLLLELKEPNGRTIEYSDNGYFNHICFEVSDIQKAVADLKALGVTTWLSEDVNVFPAYGGLKNIFFCGPDGEQIELFQYYPMKNNERTDD